MKTLSIYLRKLYLLLALVLVVVGCNSATERAEMVMQEDAGSSVQFTPPAIVAEEEAQEKQGSSIPDRASQPPVQLKVIRNASLRFQVSDYRKSIRTIETIIKRYQGFVVNSNETRIDNSLQSSLTIRVPSKNLDNLVEALADQAEFLDYKNISSEDVSTEFVDVSARLKAKQAVEQRYLDLLRQARTIKDILEIENQLRQIREEIESAQARINYINSQVAYSTVSVEVYETRAAISSGNSFWVRLLNALKNGWDILLAFILGLLNIWPFLLLVPLLFLGIRKFLRKYPPLR